MEKAKKIPNGNFITLRYCVECHERCVHVFVWTNGFVLFMFGLLGLLIVFLNLRCSITVMCGLLCVILLYFSNQTNIQAQGTTYSPEQTKTITNS